MDPHDIERRTFPIVRRGYSKDEVDAFLATVAREHGRLRRALDEAASQPQGPYGSVGAHVSAVLAAAAQAAEDMRVNAEGEAEQILKEAAQRVAEMNREIEENFGTAKEARAQAEREAAALKVAAREDADRLLQEAESKALLVEAEAKERATRLERIAQVNVESILAEGRAKYERLRRASELCADRLAALELMIQQVRQEIADGQASELPDVFAPEGNSPASLSDIEFEPGLRPDGAWADVPPDPGPRPSSAKPPAASPMKSRTEPRKAKSTE